MHRDDGPRDHAAARHSQVLPCRQLDLRSIIQKLFLHSVVKFLPAVVRERGDIVENEAAVLGIEFSGSFRIPRAPTKVSRAPTIARTTYSTQRHRSALLWTALPIEAAIPYLLATRGTRVCRGGCPNT